MRLHGSARTTPRIRAELQSAVGSNRHLAKLYGINVKTVAKWRSRDSVLDRPMGPRSRGSDHLNAQQQSQIIVLRNHGLSLDDLMGQLLTSIPKLSRSALHRCLQRLGINRLALKCSKPKRGQFEATTLGFVHIDSAEMKLGSGKQHMFVAVDRVTKFTHVAFFDRATKANGAQFLRQVIEAFPYRIHTVLTDNGVAFAEQERYRGSVTHACIGHIFERVCLFNGIKHKRTRPYHPWTNGMVERMNRTIRDATIKSYEYLDMAQLRAHVLAFVHSYNFGKHLKVLRWKTPFRTVCEAWSKDPSPFRLHPHHLIVGLNSMA